MNAQDLINNEVELADFEIIEINQIQAEYNLSKYIMGQR